MSLLKKHSQSLVVTLFFITIFYLSIKEFTDYDMWSHLKFGEVFSTQGLQFKDIFSFSAQGRTWYPHEWLTEILMYQVSHLFGLEALKYLFALFATALVGSVFYLQKHLFKVNWMLNIFVCFIFFTASYQYIAARPHMIAYTLLVLQIGILLLYILKNKNYLVLTIPITLIWTNAHGSIFLDVYLFCAYTIGTAVAFIATRKPLWLQKTKILAGASLFTTVLTILPPLRFTQYEQLWYFYQHNKILQDFVSEWSPLSDDPGSFIVYTFFVGILIIWTAWLVWKKKVSTNIFWLAPLIPLLAAAYTANRNIFLGNIMLALFLGYLFSCTSFENFSPVRKKLVIIFIATLFLLNTWLQISKSLYAANIRRYFPVHAATFIKQHLKGNMFNEYDYGAYLLYALYPTQKVLIDGRTDVYLCCEIPDFDSYIDIAARKPDPEYKKSLDTFLDKYHISFAVLRTQKLAVSRKISRILENDPNWTLVYWDDVSQIFVKKDGKNADVIKAWGAVYATPYNKEPFPKGKEKEALSEYERMIQIVDSAKSRNNIGFILAKQGKFQEAENEFRKAIDIDPTQESAYMNLAELMVRNHNLSDAIALYEKAEVLAPNRGLIYIRLGQLTLQQEGNKDKAKAIWEDGLQKTVDPDMKKVLKHLLQE